MGDAGKDELPPVPDPQTGEPWPPRGRGWAAFRTAKLERRFQKERERSERRRPDPPPGEGPVLAWYRVRRRVPLRMALGTFNLLVVYLVLYIGLEGEAGLRVLRDPGSLWLYIIPALVALGAYAGSRGEKVSAGALWFQTRKGWVRTYQLCRIQTRRQDSGTNTGVHVDLEDTLGRTLSVPLKEMQLDRDIWDLVYNGLLHSVTRGCADISESACRDLGLYGLEPHS